MLVRQLFDSQSSTYTYLLVDPVSRDALLIDTVFEQHLRDLALLRELGVTLRYTLETHTHADHVTGAWLMKEATDSKIVASTRSGASCADLLVDHGDRLKFGNESLEVRATPGHTDGCVSYVAADHSMAFTGDALLIRGSGRTDFQQGDAETLFRSVREQVFSLPDGCVLYPGHDYSGRTLTTVQEEKAHNPRLGLGKSEADFVGYVEHLELAHPRKIDIAVPANLRCGSPDANSERPALPTWGPVIQTYAGLLEIDPQWVHDHRREVTVLDVRQSDERSGPLSHVADSINIPIEELADRIDELGAEKPIVTVCHSGARSSQATRMLAKRGVEQVANLAGGMIRWHALGLPVPPQ